MFISVADVEQQGRGAPMSGSRLTELQRYTRRHPLRSLFWLAVLIALPLTVASRAKRYDTHPLVLVAMLLVLQPLLILLFAAILEGLERFRTGRPSRRHSGSGR
jgi:drug/metabolite transporter (DMT)-like permease